MGIGRWVFHNREYLVAIRPFDGALAMNTMRFHDELVPVKDLDIQSPSRKPSDKELNMAGKLVESLQAKWKPDAFEDTYRERMLTYIEAKAKGKLEKIEQPSEAQDAGDLMAALEASLSGTK